jgi:hypothetical protein
MSCAYYVRTKDTNMAFDLLPGVDMMKETRDYQIYLGQTSIGNPPVLRIHSYNDFKELKKILLDTNYNFSIIDEYDKEMTPDDFIQPITEKAHHYREHNISHKHLMIDDDGIVWTEG